MGRKGKGRNHEAKPTDEAKPLPVHEWPSLGAQTETVAKVSGSAWGKAGGAVKQLKEAEEMINARERKQKLELEAAQLREEEEKNKLEMEAAKVRLEQAAARKQREEEEAQRRMAEHKLKEAAAAQKKREEEEEE